MTSVYRLLIALALTIASLQGVPLIADEPQQAADPSAAQPAPATGSPGSEQAKDRFELSDDVRDLLSPLFLAIKNADVSRATIEVLSDSLITGRIIESKKSIYQIASKAPDKFTIYLKEPSERARIYSDGASLVVALAPDAFFRCSETISNQQAMLGLPIPMGPYPEPILALTLAGVDPATALVSGMKSIEIVDEKDFRESIPAVHLHAVQADEVNWDLWLSKQQPPRPLRMLVDLTPMLLSSAELRLPKGYSHQIRFDFVSWRVTGQVDDSLFSFTPAADAKEYKSLQHYTESMTAANNQSSLLGKNAPQFAAELLNADRIEAKDLANRVVVIDFWASWYQPCADILPLLKEVTDDFADKDVVFLTFNIRENEDEIKAFLQTQQLDIPVALDKDGAITKSFLVETLPQTLVIGKNGKVESIHTGFPGTEQLKQRLRDELEVLSMGGQIATSELVGSANTANQDEQDNP